MSLLLPPNITDATETFVPAEQAAQDGMVAAEFRKLLKQLDPRLDIVFVFPTTEPSPWPVTGRFYMIRHNELTDDSFWMVQDEMGGYSAPTMQHFHALCAHDSHAHPDVWKKVLKGNDKRVKDAESRMEAKRAEFREKLLERLEFNYSSQLAVTERIKKQMERGDARLDSRPAR